MLHLDMTRDLTRYRHRPLAFLASYVLRHWRGHAVVLASVVLAVIAPATTQYGTKGLV